MILNNLKFKKNKNYKDNKKNLKVNRKEYHMLRILLINLDLIQKEQV